MKQFLILSNCQGAGIWRVLEKVPCFAEAYTVKYYANYVELGEKQKIDIIDDIKTADVILYQPVDSENGSYRTTEVLKHKKDSCILLGFPYTRCNWLWPFFLERCMVHKEEFRIYDFGIIQNLQKTVSNTDIIEMYKNHQISFHMKERMAESIALLKEKEEEKQLDIKTSNYILENYKKKRLFFMFSHPTKALLVYCANQILQKIGINVEIPETIMIDRYNDHKYWPIPQCVKEELELEFDEQKEYTYYEDLLEKQLPQFEKSWNVYDKMVQTYYCHENKTMFEEE